MVDSLKLRELALHEPTTYKPVPFGKEMAKQFQFDEAWKNMNHGSFGASPRDIKNKQRQHQDLCESNPDPFIRYLYPKALDVSREAVAKLLNVPTSTVVFVPNATTGVNTVLRNIVWKPEGNDEILYFNTIYGACGKTIEYISEYTHEKVKGREIPLVYPLEDAALVTQFKEAIGASRKAGKNPRVAVIDSITSQPGLRVPFEELIAICASEGILSMVDGAHGVGHIPLDLSALKPDFFTSNLHKWLFVPRGCALLYVPEKNQPLIRSPLPTSHGFVPKTPSTLVNPLPASKKSEFVNNFEFVGTIDNTNYLVVAEALKWRQEVCGGEEAITDYNIKLAKEGGEVVAKILGTKILDNATNTLTNCAMVNVQLPLAVGESKIKTADVGQATKWLLDTAMVEYRTFVPFLYNQREKKWWVRLSAQIYLDLDDFKVTAGILKTLCERVEKGEHLEQKSYYPNH
ncbi:aminotransferase family protein [Phlyctema vagabunda]|uniref:Aminotransferase family protein n=1 Tax=Phlyctema vagabunda TaxID=108571 RepID=A0ABR4PV99_9HELO